MPLGWSGPVAGDNDAETIKQFNKRIRAVYLPELTIGGKQIQTEEIYKLVSKYGGCEKTTVEKHWKDVADPFDFPETCTNAAYVIRRFYERICINYERVVMHGAALSDLIIEAEAPEPLVKRTTKPVAESRQPYVQPTVPYVKAPSMPQPQVLDFSKLDADRQDLKYLYGIHKSRISLSLQSGLQNEIDWAINKLVSLSFVCPDNFHIGSVPELLDCLLELLKGLFDMLSLNLFATNFETTVKKEHITSFSGNSLRSKPEVSATIERALQVLHIMRNFSFLEQNAAMLSETQPFITVLAKGVALPQSSTFIRIKQHCVDIAENLSPNFTLTGQSDFFLVCFKSFLYESDRSLILSSIRTQTRLLLNPANHAVLQKVDRSMVERMCNLMLIADEEIVSSTLEYLYQYTSLNKETPLLLAESTPRNIVHFICKFLQWKNLPQPLAFPQASGAPQLRGPESFAQPKKYTVKQETRTIITKQPTYPAQTYSSQTPGYPQSFTPFNSYQMQQAMMQMQTTPMQMFRPPVSMQGTPQQRTQTPQFYQTPHQSNPGGQMMQPTQPAIARQESSTPPNGALRDDDAMEVDKNEAADKTSSVEVLEWKAVQVNGSPKLKRKIEFKEPSASIETPSNQSDEFKSTESVQASNSNETNTSSFEESLKQLKAVSPQKPVLQFQYAASAPLIRPQMTQVQMIQMQQMQMQQYQMQQAMMNTPGMYPTFNYATPQQPQQPQQPTFVNHTKTVTEDVKYEVCEEPAYTYQCKWAGCDAVCDDEEHLEAHVQHHVNATDEQHGFTCCWSGCTSTHKKFTSHTPGLESRQQLANHLAMHFPLRSMRMKEVLKPYKELIGQAKPEGQGLSGIPLTALLVLRNLSVDKTLFYGCEDDLAVLMAVDVRYSRFIGQILGD